MAPVRKVKTYGVPRKNSSMCRSLIIHPTSLIQKPSRKKKKVLEIRELPARKNGQTLLCDDSLQVSLEDTFDKLFRKSQKPNSDKINKSEEKSRNLTNSKRLSATRLGEPSTEKIEESLEIEVVRRAESHSLSYIEVPKAKNRLECPRNQTLIVSSTPVAILPNRKKAIVNRTISPITRQISYDISEIKINKKYDISSKENSFSKFSLIDTSKECSSNFINLRNRLIFKSGSMSISKSRSMSIEMKQTQFGVLTERNNIVEDSLRNPSQVNFSQNETDYLESMEAGSHCLSKLQSTGGRFTNFITERRKQTGIVGRNFSAATNFSDSCMSRNDTDSLMVGGKLTSTKPNEILSNIKNGIEYIDHLIPKKWDGSDNGEELSLQAQSVHDSHYKRNNPTCTSVMQCSDVQSDIFGIYNIEEHEDISMDNEYQKTQASSLDVSRKMFSVNNADFSHEKENLNHNFTCEMKYNSEFEENSSKQVSPEHLQILSILSNKQELINSTDISMQEQSHDEYVSFSEKLPSCKQSNPLKTQSIHGNTKDNFSQSTDMSVQDKTYGDEYQMFVAKLSSCLQTNHLTSNLDCQNTREDVSLNDISVQETTGGDKYHSFAKKLSACNQFTNNLNSEHTQEDFSQLTNMSVQESMCDNEYLDFAERLSSCKQSNLDHANAVKECVITNMSVQESVGDNPSIVAENFINKRNRQTKILEDTSVIVEHSIIEGRLSTSKSTKKDTKQGVCNFTDLSTQETTAGSDHFVDNLSLNRQGDCTNNYSNHQQSQDIDANHSSGKNLETESYLNDSVPNTSADISGGVTYNRQLVVDLTNCFFPQPNESCSSNDSTGLKSGQPSILGCYSFEKRHLMINLTNNFYDHQFPENTTIMFDRSADLVSDKSRCPIGKFFIDKKQLWINLTNHMYPHQVPDNISMSLTSEETAEAHNSVHEDTIDKKQLVIRLSNCEGENQQFLIRKKGSDIRKDNGDVTSPFYGFESEEHIQKISKLQSRLSKTNDIRGNMTEVQDISSDVDVIESSFVGPLKIDFTQFKKPALGKTLKAGKMWRRSFSVYKKQNTCDRTSIAVAEDCNYVEGVQEGNTSSVRNRRISIRIVPVKVEIEPEPSKELTELEEYAITTGYVQSAAEAEQERLQHNLENSFRCLSLRRQSIVDNPHHHPVTARDIVLRKCGQTEPIPFEECYPHKSLQNCRKIGEGVYGEVFLLKNQSGGTSVLKVIPIEGDLVVNGERQKKYEEILSEIIIATELHNLRYNPTNKTSAFSEVQKIQCVQGRYPERLLDLWDLYNETKVSENDCPEVFGDEQLYIVLQLGNAGTDLEAYVFNNAVQAFSMFKQVAFGLAVAEESLKFEHRDLHWGNVLLNTVEKNKVITYYLDGKHHTFTSYGIEATVIDFTLSRIEDDGVVIFNDLSLDPDLFTAEGDYQFEVYRLMQKKNENNWQHFEPYTNILWLHYILDKASTALRYKYAQTKTHKENLARMKKLADEILAFKSAKDFVTNYFL